MEGILHQLRLVVYHIIDRVSYMSGGFFRISEPSTVGLFEVVDYDLTPCFPQKMHHGTFWYLILGFAVLMARQPVS